MSKGDIFKELIENPAVMMDLQFLHEKYQVLLALAHHEDPVKFQVLEGLTWPNGRAIMISSKQDSILRSQASAKVGEIYESPYFAEIGHSERDFLRLLEIILSKLGYHAGLRNQIKAIFKYKMSAAELGMSLLKKRPIIFDRDGALKPPPQELM